MNHILVVVKGLLKDDTTLRLTICQVLQFYLVIKGDCEDIRLRQHNTLIIKIFLSNKRINSCIKINQNLPRGSLPVFITSTLLLQRCQLISLNDDMLRLAANVYGRVQASATLVEGINFGDQEFLDEEEERAVL